MKCIPCIHPIIYDRIDHSVCHCKPIKSEEDLRYIFELDYRLIMIVVDEIYMVRQPTNAEYNHNYKEHLHNL